MDVEDNILQICKDQFGTNLAAVVLFGSYNGGPYKDGESDIDISVLLHKRERLALQDEKAILTAKGEILDLSVHHLETIEEMRDRIYREGSWTTWMMLIAGSKYIYTTAEFDSFIHDLKIKPLFNENLINYLEHKDELELGGYLKKLRGGI